MAQEIEIEFKNLLNEDEYSRLENFFNIKDKEANPHINHYFETENFDLKKKQAALRIREKDNYYQLTLKEPHPEGLLETHDTMSTEEAASWINNNIIPKPQVAVQLNELGIDFAALRYGGTLTTNRKETVYKDTTIVLDYSTYNGQEDFELEVEAYDKTHGEKVFRELLSELNISKKETPNKIQRFYSSLS